jgi:hypothetical protein
MTHGLAELGCGRMHYVVAGAGSEIVLLHGRPGFWFDHRHVLPRVAGLGHAVAPDFSGFGDSEAIRGDPVEAAEPDSPAHRREALRARGAARGVVPAPLPTARRRSHRRRSAPGGAVLVLLLRALGAGRDQIRPSELATVVGVDARPGAFASSLAWYRARAAQRGQRRVPAVIEVPTVALWGP